MPKPGDRPRFQSDGMPRSELDLPRLRRQDELAVVLVGRRGEDQAARHDEAISDNRAGAVVRAVGVHEHKVRPYEAAQAVHGRMVRCAEDDEDHALFVLPSYDEGAFRGEVEGLGVYQRQKAGRNDLGRMIVVSRRTRWLVRGEEGMRAVAGSEVTHVCRRRGKGHDDQL